MTIEILFGKLKAVFSLIASESITIDPAALRAVAAARGHGALFPQLVNVNLLAANSA
jgi:hypothetical protein